MSNPKHIHFVEDVDDLGAAYYCQRCGHATATAFEMKEHRDGMVSGCLRARIKQRVWGRKA